MALGSPAIPLKATRSWLVTNTVLKQVPWVWVGLELLGYRRWSGQDVAVF